MRRWSVFLILLLLFQIVVTAQAQDEGGELPVENPEDNIITGLVTVDDVGERLHYIPICSITIPVE